MENEALRTAWRVNRRAGVTIACCWRTCARGGWNGQPAIFRLAESPFDVTYLADTVILLRYFEASGHVRRAVSVIKKRSGAHESSIREFAIGKEGLSVGEPLEQFQGVLRGVPTIQNDLPMLRSGGD